MDNTIKYSTEFIYNFLHHFPRDYLQNKNVRYVFSTKNEAIQKIFASATKDICFGKKMVEEGLITDISTESVRLYVEKLGAKRFMFSFSKEEYFQFLDKNNEVIPLLIKCKYCDHQKIILPDYFKNHTDGEIDIYLDYCEKCSKKYLEKCLECNKINLKKYFKVTTKGDRLCKYCYDIKYFLCSSCNKEFSKTEAGGSFNNGIYCSECWDLRFRYCEVCERPYYNEDLILNEEFGIYHCGNCRPQIKIVKNYHYKPAKWKYLKEKWEIPLYMGIELEVEPFIFDGTPETLQKTAYTFKNFLRQEFLDNFIYLKTDSSIRGFEIVTHPFTLQYSHNHIKWNKILQWLMENNYSSFRNGRCGFHVHLDRNYFSDMDIIKMRAFFSGVSNEIFKFSRREDKNNTFCIYEIFDKKKFFNFSQDGRHCAFNINTNKNTVEIRVFRGTLNINRFVASLQFCDAAANFIKIVSSGFILNNVNNEKLLWKTFLNFSKEKSVYNHFINYIKFIENGKFFLEKSCIEAKNEGIIKYHNLKFENKNGEYVVLNRNGTISINDTQNNKLENYPLPQGALILIGDGKRVSGGEVFVHWEPYTLEREI